jgi:hypothetical protein
VQVLANYFSRLVTRRKSVNSPRPDKGIALITVILVLTLVSAMMVGLAWLVMSDQKLGGNNSDRQLAFYGAEAGMESLTASLENAFDANYALNAAAINGIMTNPGPPTNIPNVQYLAPGSSTNGSGYVITFTPSAANANLPASHFSTISTGPYAGLVALMTPYTLTVTAHTTSGSEVKLQRRVQTVGIPVFQFGIFSQTDLSFFAGPDFDFGGRVHTNGNLWLAEGDGSTLTLEQKATAAGQIITANLENGWRTTTGYNGVVNITTGSGFQNLITQTPPDSVTGTNNYVNNISAYDTNFAGMASTIYNGNIAVGQTGATVLNIAIATPAIGGQPIDLIRRPVPNEDTTNFAKLSERYYSQVSLRILLSDYGPGGTCASSDISSSGAPKLPILSANGANSPVDLATLAWDTALPVGHPYQTPPGWLAPAGNIGTSLLPLPTSGAQNAGYTATDGYWVQKWFPIITGCIKIDYQTAAGGAFTDVTTAILNQGYTGRDINPQVAAGGKNPPLQPSLPAAAQVAASGPTANGGVVTVGCPDPSPGAIIRLARVRDNPSWAGNPPVGCPVPAAALAQHGTDYWPNVLYDTREGLLRDNALTNVQLPVAGAMYYVELDVAKLAAWFTANSAIVNNTTGYSVYFSDRRGNQKDPTPPASVGGANVVTGGFGYSEFVNPGSASGCPDNTLNQGEDVEGDYDSTGVDSNPILRTYGNDISPTPANLWPINGVGTQLGAAATLFSPIGTAILQNNPSCNGTGNTWPFAIATDPQDLRENPPLFFRRALKLVNGSTIAMGTCNSVPCGLTIVSENPVYIQGDYNNPGLNTAFTGASVGASVIADAVTLLSNKWNDVNSFAFPYLSNTDRRVASDTTYRLAISGGKGMPFKLPTVGAPPQDFGTDGGTHNFLRYLEDWGGGAPAGTLWYEGSIVSMYYSHQAVGTYKCCNTVYSPPTRAYQFDTNFLTPNLLPPLTPMLRAINTIGFTQILLPTQ